MRRTDDKFPDNGFEAWGGYMQAKIAKLEEQFSDRSDLSKESNLFQGISIYVNGYTNPSADQLKVLMAKHGGVYHTYQRSSDYVIAANLPDTKVKRLTTSRVVKPQWITESIAADRLLDYKQFLLYSKHTHTQPQLQFHKLASNTTTDADSTTTRSNSKSEDIIESKCSQSHTIIQPEKLPAVKIKLSRLHLQHRPSNEPNSGSSHSIEPTIILDEPMSKTSDVVLPLIKFPSTSSTANQIANLDKSTSNDYKPTDAPARTAVDPKFLSEFYSNSRLHHISQLGAGFKQHINELREASDFVFPARMELKEMINNMEHPNESPITASSFKGGKLIMHIDMDCFFVSVGLRSRPELRGLPVAVTHSAGARARAHPPPRPGVDRHAEFSLYRQKKAKALSKATGLAEDSLLEENVMSTRVDDISEEGDTFSSMSEIASCSYEARQKGLHNGMFMGAALRLCPDLKTIPYDFDGYKEAAYTLYNTIAKYTLDIEAVSCDEMYVDCTELASALRVPAQRLARALRHEVRARTGCPCSAGFGGNRLQARLATKRAKPDGQFFLTAEMLDTFMMDVKLEDLPGVGRQLVRRLEGAGAGAGATCGALRSLPAAALRRHAGAAAARQLHLQCRGDDPKPLNFVTVRKSVSAEVNYGIRFESHEQCDAFLRQLCGEVHERMRRSRVLGRCVTLKLMVRAADAPLETAKFMGHGFCDTLSRSAALPAATDEPAALAAAVLLLRKKLDQHPREMRGVGVQVTKLESSAGKRHDRNAMKAFLIKPTPKLDTNVDDDLTVSEEINTETSYKCEREIQSESRLEENLAASVARTPPKRIISNNDAPHRDRTPVKMLLRSPSAIKRSPVTSPAKKKSLGLTGRRRGRPPKNATAIVPSRSSASKEVMNKFLMGDRARVEPNCPEGLDPEILAALPEDIRQEVLEHYHINNISKDNLRSNTPQPLKKAEEVKVKPQNNATERETVGETACAGREASAEGSGGAACEGTLRLPWRQVRGVVRAWLRSGAPPPPRDVALVSSHMQQLVLDRSIDGLLAAVNYLKRNVHQMQDAAWSGVYTLILDGVQETMTAVYGKPLFID